MTCDQMIRQDPIRAVLNGYRQWVAHSVAGRVRLRLPAALAGHGMALAQHLALHPEVQSVRWTSAARSLIVAFDRSTAFDRILDDLSSAGGMHDTKASTPALIVTRPAMPVLAAFVSALGGPIGLAASLLLGSMETHHVTRLPQPLRLEEPARAHRSILPRTSWHRHGRHAAPAVRRRRCPASTAFDHNPRSASGRSHRIVMH